MSTSPASQEARVELAESAEDIIGGFHCMVEAFGRQTGDAVWTQMNPGWDTPEGKTDGAERMVNRWRHTTRDDKGQANTLFIKVTLPDPHKEGRRVIAGMAIWEQASVVEGRGYAPSDDFGSFLDLEALYPGNEAEQRYLRQLYRSLVKRRIEVVKEKATSQQPAVFVLDVCAVDPAFQRKGLASKLVQWGLDEAKRRGGLEATTEASKMGRHVYERLGFRSQQDIEYDVDSEFSSRKRPSNVFMRTGSSQ
ncbi:hypothetical protein F5B20DRAFT_545212 [Whalleya microplaca]|nr:hypothetical protein F5B20DRAFT_545212 [Whalleya microplaca]